MKGYYTVKLVGGDLSTAERIELEMRFVQALEQAMGGAGCVRELCLAAAAAPMDGVPGELKAACANAEAAAWGMRPKVGGTRFSLSAWSANDL